MPPDRPRRMVLADEADVAGFRSAARQMLREGVRPADVQWQVASAASADLFGGADDAPAAAAGTGTAAAASSTGAGLKDGAGATATASGSASPKPITVPAFFVPLCERAALHADPGRFGLLYRLLWRLVHEPGLRGDALDPDRLDAEKMARMVRRDMHKMTAFVRFRPIGGDPSDGVVVAGDGFAPGGDDPAGADPAAFGSDADHDPLDNLFDEGSAAASPSTGRTDAPADARWHVAWFEPVHHIVAATAPFFARRFARMKWAILTPERCVRWDGQELAFGPGASRSDAPPADAGEQLWLTYYAHIFNPARLKLAMMQKEMPRRYWHNLPEAALIQPLTAAAHRRSDEMVAQGGSEPTHRRPAASLAMRIEAAAALPSVGTEPHSLDSLGQALQRCRECPIGEGATQAVAGLGPTVARLMLVGEQPGDQEDLRGLPFVGPAGQLLDKAFAQLGWPRDAVYLTNAVKHFKYELRGKRRIHKSPSQREAAACLHWLESEIDLVTPKALVALGATAARALLGRQVGVTRERGQWLQRADGLRVLIALHPSALLRMEPAAREPAYEAWLADLSQAAAYVTETA